MNYEDVMKQAEVAGTFLEEAGVRYFATHFKPESDHDTRAVVLAAWALAILANAAKVQSVLDTLNLAKQVGLTDEELVKELDTSHGVGEEKANSIRSRILELRQLEKLGETK